MSEVIKTTRFLELCKVIGLSEGDKINIDGYLQNPYIIMDKGIIANNCGWIDSSCEYSILSGKRNFTIIPKIKDPYTEFCAVDEMQAACKKLGIELVNDMKVVVTDWVDEGETLKRHFSHIPHEKNLFICHGGGYTSHTIGSHKSSISWVYMKLVK